MPSHPSKVALALRLHGADSVVQVDADEGGRNQYHRQQSCQQQTVTYVETFHDMHHPFGLDSALNQHPFWANVVTPSF